MDNIFIIHKPHSRRACWGLNDEEDKIGHWFECDQLFEITIHGRIIHKITGKCAVITSATQTEVTVSEKCDDDDSIWIYDNDEMFVHLAHGFKCVRPSGGVGIAKGDGNPIEVVDGDACGPSMEANSSYKLVTGK